MARSIIEDPLHVPQKRSKVIKELPNGRLLPKEMQKMSGKGWNQVLDDDIYNAVIDAMQRADEVEPPFLQENQLQLYLLVNCVLIYDQRSGLIFATKESPIEELTPEYWANLSKP